MRDCLVSEFLPSSVNGRIIILQNLTIEDRVTRQSDVQVVYDALTIFHVSKPRLQLPC